MSDQPIAADWPPSFGDTTSEYLAARSGTGTVAGQSAIVWVEGRDAVTFLQGIISQEVEALAPGEVAQSLLLEPRGKLSDVFWILRDADRVGLVTSAARAQTTMEELNHWKIRVKADLDLDERPVVEVWGRSAVETVERAGLEMPRGWADRDGVLVARLPLGSMPRVVVAWMSGPIDGTTPVGAVAATTVRIEAGSPLVGVDIDDSTIPQEAGLVDATVSFSKGCYLGQELVARIDSRGRVNRSLRGVVLRDNVIPPVGATVSTSERDVGTLTSVGESLERRAPVALALIRREAEPGIEVTVSWDGGSARATVAELPLTDF
jgi:folate-binding protein YgfZ